MIGLEKTIYIIKVLKCFDAAWEIMDVFWTQKRFSITCCVTILISVKFCKVVSCYCKKTISYFFIVILFFYIV